MPGPPPKDPRLRQRVNKTTTAAKLSTEGNELRAIPALPVRKCVECGGEGTIGEKKQTTCQPCGGAGVFGWHEQTLAMWSDVWRSPMAGEYVQADTHRLFAYAVLVDRFWWGEIELAAEIRLQGQCFGLTPLDRRRLQWEVQKVEDAQKRRPRQVEEPARKKRAPLSYLRAVK